VPEPISERITEAQLIAAAKYVAKELRQRAKRLKQPYYGTPLTRAELEALADRLDNLV
jgi:hypothetical protein